MNRAFTKLNLFLAIPIFVLSINIGIANEKQSELGDLNRFTPEYINSLTILQTEHYLNQAKIKVKTNETNKVNEDDYMELIFTRDDLETALKDKEGEVIDKRNEELAKEGEVLDKRIEEKKETIKKLLKIIEIGLDSNN